MAYSIFKFGANEILPLYGAEFNIDSGKAKNEFIDFPHGGAYDLYGNAITYHGGYEIKYSFILFGDSPADLNQKYNTLMSYYGKKDKLYRKVDGSTDLQWSWARLTQVSTPRKPENINYLNIDLTFFVFSPLWFGTLHGSWRLDSGEVLDRVGLNFDTGITYPLTNTETTFTINNAGNGTLHTFEFSISSGSTTPITGIRVQKAGETDFSWTGNLATGTQLVIDFGGISIRNSGNDAYSGFKLHDANHHIDSWGVLSPGNNTWVITRTGGNSDSTIATTYYDGFN